MKRNMGYTDRFIRLFLAGILGLLYFQQIVTGTLGNIILAFATLFALTGLIGICPLYMLFGIDTIPAHKKLQK